MLAPLAWFRLHISTPKKVKLRGAGSVGGVLLFFTQLELWRVESPLTLSTTLPFSSLGVETWELDQAREVVEARTELQC